VDETPECTSDLISFDDSPDLPGGDHRELEVDGTEEDIQGLIAPIQKLTVSTTLHTLVHSLRRYIAGVRIAHDLWKHSGVQIQTRRRSQAPHTLSKEHREPKGHIHSPRRGCRQALLRPTLRMEQVPTKGRSSYS
jgi:hypothetical protein